jgi:hypothetical protein
VLTAGQTDWYQVTVPANSRLTATVTAPGGSSLVPRLTLTGPSGQVLIQSDDGSLVQHLPPGIYKVGVSARSGAGRYQLTVAVVPTNAPFEPLSVGLLPRAVAVADVNGDGKPDLVVAQGYLNPSSGKLYDVGVSVLLGRGDGTFAPPQTIALAFNPYSVAVADVNGDGRPDIVVTEGTFNPTTGNWDNNGVSVLLGRGDGTFRHPQTFALKSHVVAVAVADVNGDGKPDLVVANPGTYNPTTNRFDNGGVDVLLGRSDGTFGPPQTFDAGFYGTSSVAVADVNGDGRPDIVTGGAFGISVLPGNGDGTFGPPQTLESNAPSQNSHNPGRFSPHSVAVADVNGDGKPDIVVAGSPSTFVAGGNYENFTLSVLLGNGEGTFQKPQTLPVDTALYSVVVADVNGDGRPDIVTGGDGGINVLLGNGDGTFQNPRTYSVTGAYHLWMAVADVNGDGRPDIVTANANLGGNTVVNTVSVLLGNGDGTFQPPQPPQAFAVGSNPNSVAVADVNGDGRPDIVTANNLFNTAGTVSVLLGNGDGTFAPQQTFAVGWFPSSVVVADVNGDGRPDIVTGGAFGISVLLGNGDGTFQNQQTFFFGPFSVIPVTMAVADVNGDGRPDLVVTHSGGYNPTTGKYDNPGVSVLLGRGDGTFGHPQTIPLGSDPTSVAVADVNGDGRPDITHSGGYNPTTGKYDNPGVSVLLGRGDGTFGHRCDGRGACGRDGPAQAVRGRPGPGEAAARAGPVPADTRPAG